MSGVARNYPAQGLCALVEVAHGGAGAAPLPEPEACGRYCPPDCGYPHDPACWLRASFNTNLGWQGPEGGSGELHARFVADLGRWLDGKGIRWSWLNTVTSDIELAGEIHRGHQGLAELREGSIRAAG